MSFLKPHANTSHLLREPFLVSTNWRSITTRQFGNDRLCVRAKTGSRRRADRIPDIDVAQVGLLELVFVSPRRERTLTTFSSSTRYGNQLSRRANVVVAGRCYIKLALARTRP